MADDEDSQPEASAAGATLLCAPCRGTGQVVSNLGGSPSSVPCPWCEGTGMPISGHDAQAARSAAAG